LAERREARERCTEICLRLGQITNERHGTDILETWQEGTDFKELKKRREANNAKRNEIEKFKKALTKKKTSLQKSVNSQDELQHIAEQQEILSIRLMHIKKEAHELNEEKEKLLITKQLHIRELKRINDEDHSQFNQLPVLQHRYLLLTLLGKGGFSEVYKGFDLVELRQVACKIHQLNTQWPEAKKQNYTKHACREYNIHKSLVHPRVVRLYDVFEIDENSFCTVLEYCKGGDLDTYLKTHRRLAEREAKMIILQIFSGLKYLNSRERPIIHYDLKPGNILFDELGGIKITDFGLSKIMEKDTDAMELTSQGAGTYWYLPPECFETGATPQISPKVDVWSAGVIFYQMLYGKKPFGNNLSQHKILQDGIIIKSANVDFPAKPQVATQAKEFICRCLTAVQKHRPDVLACWNDAYLSSFLHGKKVHLNL